MFVLELLGERDRLSLICLEDSAYVSFPLMLCTPQKK